MIEDYINQLQIELLTHNALEHSYRPAFKNLIESLSLQVHAVNEPTRSEYGAPDFVFLNKNNKDLILGYAETKDINVNLDQIEKSEQLKRYFGYSSLLLTNYLEFRFFRNGEKYLTVETAKLNGSVLVRKEETFMTLERELRSFLEGKPETITNAKKLAAIMGGKAARVRANVTTYLKEENEKNQELLRIYKIMQELLVHDLTPEKFADMYAQTLVYGLFVARYYDETPEDFTRSEARDLIPASNPFLRHFFDHIAGINFDKRLRYIVDELCDIFSVSAVREIVTQHYDLFGKAVDKDPVIHFYEDFLKEYDPKLKKNMGAYYTPVPVVQFIINAVDDVLKKEFHLPQGLTDTTKIEQSIIQQGTKTRRILHKVQILDPAVGTATFLNEAVKFIHKKFASQEGAWESYVEKELLPRLHGFELMMAPYTIAHLKLAMTFKETGIDRFDHRLGVYLTNTLEEGAKEKPDLFSFGLAEAISGEAKAASVIKHDTPIMVIIGNPPYSGESFNKGEYAMKLVEKYKYEPGGERKLQERNSKWINDDYVKFIAFAEEMIEKTGEGVVAMITNHGYLDNPTFRGMRWQLAKTFSSIYVLDLHGNAKKRETTPNGGLDKNVFDIQQGVAIIVAVKRKSDRKELADIYRADVWGTRRTKFDFLFGNTIEKIRWEKIRLNEPLYLFLNKDEKIEEEYKNGIKINELFLCDSLGFQTHRDQFAISDNEGEVRKKLDDFKDTSFSVNELKAKYSLKESSDWQIETSRKKIIDQENRDEKVVSCSYRPFDYKWTYFDEAFIDRPRTVLKEHIVNHKNISIEVSKQIGNLPWRHIFIADKPAESCLISNKTKEGNYSFPLYLYSTSSQTSIDEVNRSSNLNKEFLNKLLVNIGRYIWVDNHENKAPTDNSEISPLDVFDYTYAALYSPSYRERYKDFLKSDFPRIPVAKDKESFWKLVELGNKLRKLHLLEGPDLTNLSMTYPIGGDSIVEKVDFRGDRVFINDLQFFGNIPKEAWNFFIGGYQPAQKWLKDRKGRKLTYEDITHYQRIIKVLFETIQIMKQIDDV